MFVEVVVAGFFFIHVAIEIESGLLFLIKPAQNVFMKRKQNYSKSWITFRAQKRVECTIRS